MTKQTRVLDSKEVRSTLQDNLGEHLEFLCERPTLRIPIATLKGLKVWEEYQSLEEVEIDVALEELDCEYIDIDVEELK